MPIKLPSPAEIAAGSPFGQKKPESSLSDFKALQPKRKSSLADFQALQQRPQQPQNQGSVLGDVGRGLAAGTANLAGAVGDIPNLLTAGAVPAVSPSLSKFAEAQRAQYRPETQQAMQNIQQAEGFGGTLSAIAQNPVGAAQYVVESAPSFVPGLGAVTGAGRLARGAALAKGATQQAAQQAAISAGTKAAVGTNATLSGAFAGQQAAQGVREMPQEQLEALPDYQAMIAQGMAPEAAREALANRAGRYAGAVGAPLGAATGMVGAPIEARLAAGQAATLGGIASRIGATAGSQTLEEGLQEGAEQFAANVGQRRINPEQSLTEGVPESVALGGTLGAVAGGGLSGVGEIARLRQPQDAPPPPTEDTAPPPPPPLGLPSPGRHRMDRAGSVVMPDGSVSNNPADVEAFVADFVQNVAPDAQEATAVDLRNAIYSGFFKKNSIDKFIERGQKTRRATYLNQPERPPIRGKGAVFEQGQRERTTQPQQVRQPVDIEGEFYEDPKVGGRGFEQQTQPPKRQQPRKLTAEKRNAVVEQVLEGEVLPSTNAENIHGIFDVLDSFEGRIIDKAPEQLTQQAKALTNRATKLLAQESLSDNQRKRAEQDIARALLIHEDLQARGQDAPLALPAPEEAAAKGVDLAAIERAVFARRNPDGQRGFESPDRTAESAEPSPVQPDGQSTVAVGDANNDSATIPNQSAPQRASGDIGESDGGDVGAGQAGQLKEWGKRTDAESYGRRRFGDSNEPYHIRQNENGTFSAVPGEQQEQANGVQEGQEGNIAAPKPEIKKSAATSNNGWAKWRVERNARRDEELKAVTEKISAIAGGDSDKGVAILRKFRLMRDGESIQDFLERKAQQKSEYHKDGRKKRDTGIQEFSRKGFLGDDAKSEALRKSILAYLKKEKRNWENYLGEANDIARPIAPTTAKEQTNEAQEEAPVDKRTNPGAKPADSAPPRKERRKDKATRKRVNEMSPEEMRRELLIDPLTGLGNRRAFEEMLEDNPPAYLASIDADSLKWINDNMSPDTGDELLKAVGDALKAVDADNAYHISGDEYYLAGESEAALQAMLDKVDAALADVTLEHEKPKEIIELKGLRITYGFGQDKETADAKLKQAKREREQAGERASRGEAPKGVQREPKGVSEPDSAGGQVESKVGKKKSTDKYVVDPKKDSLRIAIAKLGGLDAAEAEAQGIDPAEIKDRKRNMALFGKPVFRRTGDKKTTGRTFDAMAEALSELGYFGPGEIVGANTLLDKLTQELGGKSVYTPDGTIAAEQARAAEDEAAKSADLDELDDSDFFNAVAENLTENDLTDFDQANESTQAVIEAETRLRDAVDEDTADDIIERLSQRYENDDDYINAINEEARRQKEGQRDKPGVGKKAESAQQERETLVLERETEADIKAREAEQQEAAKRKAEADKKAADKAKADKMRDDFSLGDTGNPQVDFLSEQRQEDFKKEVEARKQAKATKPDEQAESAKESTSEQQDDLADLPIKISPDDIDFEKAKEAYRGISMTPEKRARQEQEGYVEAVKAAYKQFADKAKTDKQKEALKHGLEMYRDAYLRLNASLLAAKSRTMSVMVTGPSKFPTAKNNKRLNTEDKRLSEFVEGEKRARLRIGELVEAAKTPEQKADDRWAKVRKDIIGSLGVIHDIDVNGAKGADRALFVSSLAGQLKRLHKNGEQELVNRALDLIEEAQAKWDKPAITPRHSIWKLRTETKTQPQASSESTPYTEKRHKETIRAIRNGTISLDDYKQAFADFLASEDEMRAELGKKTIEQLTGKKSVSGYTKAQIINSIIERRMRSYVLSDGFMWSPLTEKYRDAVKRLVESATEADLKDHAARKKAEKEETLKALNNPETLKEFNTFIAYKGEGALSDEQRATYDKLLAQQSKAAEAARTERKTAAKVENTQRAVGDGLVSELKETKHTKHGYDLFVIQLADRVDKDTYRSILAQAKQLGGWYSKFRGNGAIPGFQFKDRESAEQFQKLIAGDEQAADAVVEKAVERVEKKLDAKQQKAANRLRQQAERLNDKAEEALNAERKTNTPKRAREAAYAEANARADQAFAKTMLNLAEAIETGATEFLQNISTKAHVEELNRQAISAMQNWVAATQPSYEEGRQPGLEHIQYAALPSSTITLHSSAARDIANSLEKIKGGKALANRVRKQGALLVNDAAKAVKLIRNSGDKHTGWQLEDAVSTLRRLELMGITNDAELRTALREYLQYKEARAVEDPIKKLERELVGTNPGVDFFPTPPALAKRLVEEADIQPGMTVLEPSAGKGDIADAVKEAVPDADIEAVEMSSTLRNILQAKGYNVTSTDFMTHDGEYDRIVMNPPFSDGMDAEHVQHAYDMLKPGGKLVAITGEGIFFRSDKKSKAFRDWLDSVDGTSEKLPEGSFKSSFRPTGVATRLVVVEKPAIEQGVSAETEKEMLALAADIKAAQQKLDKLNAGQMNRLKTSGRSRGRSASYSANASNTAELRDKKKRLLADMARSEIAQGRNVPSSILDAVGSSIDYDSDGSYAPVSRENARYSQTQAEGITTVAVRDALNLSPQAKQRLLNSQRVRIVQSVSDIPGTHPDDVAGAYHDGVIWLVADNLTPRDAYAVLLHEVVHAELAKLPEFKKILADVEAGVKRGGRPFVEARNTVPRGTPAEHITEETLAYLVQNNPRLPVVRRLIAAIRAALRKLGLVENYTADDMVRLAHVALKRMAGGNPTTRLGDALYNRADRTSFQGRDTDTLPQAAQQAMAALNRVWTGDRLESVAKAKRELRGNRDAIDWLETNQADVSPNTLYSRRANTPDDIAALNKAGKESVADAIKMYADPIRNKTRPATDKIQAWINKASPLGSLPDQAKYLKRRYLTLGKIADIDTNAKALYDAFRNINEEDAKNVYTYLTTKNAKSEIVKDEAARKAAVDAKKTITEVGQKLVDRGLLDQATYESNKGAYLPRIYLKHLLDENSFVALGTGKKPSDLGYLKRRKDIPESVRRLVLGEITDPGYLAAKGYGSQMRDIALLDWLAEISKNNEWVIPEQLIEWQGQNVTPFWLKSEAARIREQSRYYTADDREQALVLAQKMDDAAGSALENYTDVPKGYMQIPKTPRYGHLRGLIVRKEIYDDIVGSTNIMMGDISIAERILGNGGLATKMTQLFKMSKVALNPPAQIRNFVSNAVLMHLSGVPFHLVGKRMIDAIRDIRANGQYYQIAKKYGVTESTFSAQELFRMERKLLDLEARRAGPVSFATLKNFAGKVGDKASDIYQMSEAIFKTAKIIDAMKREKMSEGDAALEAQKWLFDYSLVTPSMRYLRNAPVGVPFITFYFKALPRLIEVATKHPLRLAPYLAIPFAMTAIIASMEDVDDDDVTALQKALPKWLQERGHAYFLPVRDENGRWQAMDMGYFFPWTTWTELASELGDGEFGKAMMTSGLLGGPLPDMIAAVKTNTDPFTGKQIVNEYDPPAKKMAAVMGYLYTLGAPTWLTNYGFAGHMYRAINGTVDKYGEPKTSEGQALLRLLGVNVYPIEPTRTRAENIKRMQFEISQVKRRATQLMRDRNLSPAGRREIRQEYNEIIKQRMAALRQYAKESRIHPNLR